MNHADEISHSTNIGDAVVSGLLAGILAGVIMVAYLVAAGFLMGDTVAATLVRFDPGSETMQPERVSVWLKESRR